MCFEHCSNRCVPYKGNQEWIKSLVKGGTLTESESWRPWFNDIWPSMPAGYVTTYVRLLDQATCIALLGRFRPVDLCRFLQNVTGVTHNFHFLTIRLAGHSKSLTQPADFIGQHPS